MNYIACDVLHDSIYCSLKGSAKKYGDGFAILFATPFSVTETVLIKD